MIKRYTFGFVPVHDKRGFRRFLEAAYRSTAWMPPNRPFDYELDAPFSPAITNLTEVELENGKRTVGFQIPDNLNNVKLSTLTTQEMSESLSLVALACRNHAGYERAAAERARGAMRRERERRADILSRLAVEYDG